MNIPYSIEVAVVQGPRIVGAPIKRRTRVWAMLAKDGRQAIYLKDGRLLHPGCYLGDMTPVLTEKDVS